MLTPTVGQARLQRARQKVSQQRQPTLIQKVSTQLHIAHHQFPARNLSPTPLVHSRRQNSGTEEGGKGEKGTRKNRFPLSHLPVFPVSLFPPSPVPLSPFPCSPFPSYGLAERIFSITFGSSGNNPDFGNRGVSVAQFGSIVKTLRKSGSDSSTRPMFTSATACQ